MIKGILYIFSAPSGTGKSSLIQSLIKTKLIHKAQISISYTTRAARSGEINGKHYFFINHKEFKKMIDNGEFIEYAKVFDNYYGTSRKFIEENLATGIDVFLDIDWQGAQQIRTKMPLVCSIFILPPSKEELNRRLHSRSQDSEEIISRRMEQIISEISHYIEYDYLVINNDFNIALNDLKFIIYAEHLNIKYQKRCHKSLITKLLTN